MKILAFVNRDNAPAYHRLIMPLLLMDDADVFVTNNLLDEHFEKGCDVFMYNRISIDQHYDEILKRKEKYGFKICVDIDDFWELDPHHVSYSHYIETEFAKKQISHIKRADIVFTTHGRLAAEIRPYNSNVHVLPNAIPHKGQFAIERKPSPLTRLFWQGSVTHQEDIKLLQRPIDCLNAIAGKIKMVLAGYTKNREGEIIVNGESYYDEHEEIWYKMAMDYTAKAKHQYLLLPGLPVDKYYRHYANADICLIPLLNSPFNRHKSNLKVLEAANLSLPVICSEVHPYLDLPVLYAKGTGDWIKHITRLVGSKKRQKECGQELKEYCDQHFNFHKINRERKQILEYVSKTVSV